jgi:predicted RNA-binding Zn-ribbon protein involved in translation (DUF1610 family)
MEKEKTFVHYKCSCGKLTKFGKPNPIYKDVARWLDTFRCPKCGKKK